MLAAGSIRTHGQLTELTLHEVASGVPEGTAFIDGTAEHITGDVLGDIASPAFSSIEGDNATRVIVFPRKDALDDCSEVSLGFIGLPVGAAGFAKIVEHDMDRDLVPEVGNQR